MRIGRYQVLSQLTSGGMAELFLGYTAGPGGFRKYVVIKRILPDAKNNDLFVKMFLDEARLTAAFSHPNITQVFELGEEETDLYLAMEFISGQNLNQVTQVCAKKRAVLPMGFSIAAVHDTALALHYAHTFKDPSGQAQPVIHRDVAQKNMMVTYEGVVKLLDFGIAKARGQLGRTKVGTVKGTTGYMSPEQVRGDPLDGRSDVFGLGVVLFEMITGRRLFSADSEIDEMKMILSAPIPRPSALVSVVPEQLSDVVMRALAREQADRWPSGKDFARALQTQCGRLMFDQEHRAAFMKEHFEDQIQATAALLQSANDDTPMVDAAVKAIRGDGGSVSNAQRLSKEEISAARRKPKKQAVSDDADADLQLAMLQGQAEALGGPGPVPPTQRTAALKTDPDAKASGFGWVLPTGLLLAMLLLGAALYKVVFDDGSPPPLDMAQLNVATPLERPQEGPPPEKAATEQPDADVKEEQPKKKVPVRTGQVTVVTFPEATVFRGAKELGKTPLFNAELPLGTHMLTLVGADGVKHVLSVPVREGKNTPIKVKLEELPVMSDQRIVFAHTVEGLFYRALAGQVSSSLKEELKPLGLDLDQPPREVRQEAWVKVLAVTVRGLYPRLSADEGYYRLGETVIAGYGHTLMGKALFGMMRVLGPLRTVRRASVNLRNGNTYSEARLTEHAPNHHEVWTNECNGNPHYVRAVLFGALDKAGAKGLAIKVLSFDGHAATFDISWT